MWMGFRHWNASTSVPSGRVPLTCSPTLPPSSQPNKRHQADAHPKHQATAPKTAAAMEHTIRCPDNAVRSRVVRGPYVNTCAL